MFMVPRNVPDMLLADAIAENDVHKVKSAIRLGANVSIHCNWALRKAADQKPIANLDIVQELLLHCEQYSFTLDSVLVSALKAGNDELLKLLLASVRMKQDLLRDTLYRMICCPLLIAVEHDDYNLMVTVLTNFLVQEFYDKDYTCMKYYMSQALFHMEPWTVSRLRAFHFAQRTCFTGALKDLVSHTIQRYLSLEKGIADAFLMDEHMSPERTGWLVAVARAVARRYTFSNALVDQYFSNKL
jgi:hypothetical protein